MTIQFEPIMLQPPVRKKVPQQRGFFMPLSRPATDVIRNSARFVGYPLCDQEIPRDRRGTGIRCRIQPIREFSCRFAAESATPKSSSTVACRLPARRWPRNDAGFLINNIATALGPHRAGVEDQVGMAARAHRPAGMSFLADPLAPASQQRCRVAPLPARGGPQAAPGRALAQKAPPCHHKPDGLARRWPSTHWLLVAGVDDRGDKMLEPQIHRCCPCPVPQIWAATAQDRQSGHLNPQ